MAWDNVSQFVQHSGGGKGFVQEVGFFQFTGTVKDHDLPTKLSQIYHASFLPWPQGTTSETGGLASIRLTEGTVGTTDGILTVSGTSVSVSRLVEHGGTAAALAVSYMLVGRD